MDRFISVAVSLAISGKFLYFSPFLPNNGLPNLLIASRRVNPSKEPFVITFLSNTSQDSPIILPGGSFLLNIVANLLPPQMNSLKYGLNFNGYNSFIAALLL